MKTIILAALLFSGLTCFAAPVPDAYPLVSQLDVTAPGIRGNRLPSCHFVGQVTEWATLPLNVLDVTGQPLGVATVGLAQFNSGARLEGCAPGTFQTQEGAALSLENKFVNVVIANDQVLNGEAVDRAGANAIASRLASTYYRLAEANGTAVPLTPGVPSDGLGWISFKFTIVLVKSASGFDAVVYRETTGTKFAPHLSEEDRRASRVSWSSVK